MFTGAACVWMTKKSAGISLLFKISAQRSEHGDSRAFQEFSRLWNGRGTIIAAMYQKDEEERPQPCLAGKGYYPVRCGESDLQRHSHQQYGKSQKMSASILAKHFSQKRFSRQRITNILNHKFPVERFDLLTLGFFIVSQEMAEEDPYARYRYFIEKMRETLHVCGMSEIYIVNPYECFLLMCLLTDCPLAVFSEIWEKSYEENE